MFSLLDKQKVCFIAARLKGDYCYYGIEALGYPITIPYKDYNLFMRCLREAWFRLKLPGKQIWFNNKCREIKADLYIVRDSLIVPEFLNWLRECHPDARIILEYDNLARTTINPDSITDPTIEKWTFDKGDSARYGMNIGIQGLYYNGWTVEKAAVPAYDVVYVGRDKGRAEKLFAFEDKLKNMGLKTCFHICADRRFLTWKKPYYKPLLEYKDYLSLIGNTGAMLNIVQEGGDAITLREVEAAFHEIKCITNNKTVKEYQFYHPSRYFVLGEEPLEKLPEFLNTPFLAISQEEKRALYFERGVEEKLNFGQHK